MNQMMDNECEYCDGHGRVFNPSMICLQIRHEVNKQAKQTEAAAIRVEAAPVVIDYIHHNKLDVKWENETGKTLVLREAKVGGNDVVVRPEFS